MSELFSLLASSLKIDCVNSERAVTSHDQELVQSDVVAVMTRAQAQAKNTVVVPLSDTSEKDNPLRDGLGNTLSEEIFKQGREWERQSQSQRCLSRHRHAEESLKNIASEWTIMDMTPTEFEVAQCEDSGTQKRCSRNPQFTDW